MYAMCPMRPIPNLFPVLHELMEVIEHLVEDNMIEDSDAETIPWTFNADAAEFVPQRTGDTAPQTPRGIFGSGSNLVEAPSGVHSAEPARGATRVWADMTDSDCESAPAQETAAERSARRLEELHQSSLQDIVILDGMTYQTLAMQTDGNTEVGEVHTRAAAHFGIAPSSFILSYNGQPLLNSMDITTITEHDLDLGTVQAFHVVRRPLFVNIEFRTVQHGDIRLHVHLTDSVESLYTRISFLTGWPVGNFTLRYHNHQLDNMQMDMTTLGVYCDTFMVMIGALAGGTQRFHIGTPGGSPCAAAASRLDESDISDMELETESSTSMPDMARLAVVESSALVLPSSSPPPSVRVGLCLPHALPSLPVLAGHCPLHQASSAAASGSAGVGSSAAAPPWVPSDSVLTLSVQGLKRTYADAREAAPGRAYQRSVPESETEF